MLHRLLMVMAGANVGEKEQEPVGRKELGRRECSRDAWHKVGELIGGILSGPSASYDQAALPDPDGVNVSLSFLVQKISSLDELTSDFDLDILYDEMWTDPRLRFPLGDLCRNNFSLKPEYRAAIWRPDTCVVNSKSAQIHSSPSNNSFVILHHDGLVWASYRMKIRAPCRLNLHLFPFDTSTCILQIESYSLNADEVRLNWDETPIGFLDAVNLPDFRLVGWRVRKEELEYPNGKWDRLEAHFVFSRLYGYYFVQAYFPTFMTVCCSWLTFLLETRSVSARLSLSVSSLLALTFQLSTVTDELPRVSHLKCLDIWLFTCILSIFSVNLEVAAVSFLARYERARHAGALLILSWLEHLRESRVPKTPPSAGATRRRGALIPPSAPSARPQPLPATAPNTDGLIRTATDGHLARFESPSLDSGQWSASNSTNGAALDARALLISPKTITPSRRGNSEFNFRWSHAATVFRNFWAVVKSLSIYHYWKELRKFKLTAQNVDNASMICFPGAFFLFILCYFAYYGQLVFFDDSHVDLVFV